MLPIFLISIVGFIATSWGTQFYITCIEAVIFLIAFIIITIIEFKTAKMHGYNRVMDPVGKEYGTEYAYAPNEDEMDKKRKQDILRAIFNRLKDGQNGFSTNKIENCVDGERDHIHGRYSLPDQHQYQEDDDDFDASDMRIYPHSYPVSPRTREKYENPPFPFAINIKQKDDKYPDNVY
jgi:Ca2+/Na+ antiporter